MQTAAIVIVAQGLLSMLIIVGVGVYFHLAQARYREALDWYSQHFDITRIGRNWTASLDGGKTRWYITGTEQGEVLLYGRADMTELHLAAARQTAADALAEYVRRDGAIDPGNPGDVELLANAGFRFDVPNLARR